MMRAARSMLHGLLLSASACAPGPQPPRMVPAEARTRERDGMQSLPVHEGEFSMGSSLEMSREAKKLCEAFKGASARAAFRATAFTDERPAHEVRLDAYWIDRTEVTNGQYWPYMWEARHAIR